MRTLTIDQRRALRVAAFAAVKAEAAAPLPSHARKRAAEGLRRRGAAVRAVMDEARESGEAPESPCNPGDMKTAIESVRLLVQAVYDVLKMFGVIGADGSIAAKSVAD